MPKAVVSESARRSATKAAARAPHESAKRSADAAKLSAKTAKARRRRSAKCVEHPEGIEQRHQGCPVTTAVSAGEQHAASACVELVDHVWGRQQRRPGDLEERQGEEAISAVWVLAVECVCHTQRALEDLDLAVGAG